MKTHDENTSAVEAAAQLKDQIGSVLQSLREGRDSDRAPLDFLKLGAARYQDARSAEAKQMRVSYTEVEGIGPKVDEFVRYVAGVSDGSIDREYAIAQGEDLVRSLEECERVSCHLTERAQTRHAQESAAVVNACSKHELIDSLVRAYRALLDDETFSYLESDLNNLVRAAFHRVGVAWTPMLVSDVLRRDREEVARRDHEIAQRSTPPAEVVLTAPPAEVDATETQPERRVENDILSGFKIAEEAPE